MKIRYAVLTSLPFCERESSNIDNFSRRRCNGCRVGELLMFRNGSYWYASDKFESKCSWIDEENVKFISTKEANKYMIAGAI